MQLNPARGRKLGCVLYDVLVIDQGFMQLNPARGRKPATQSTTNWHSSGVGVYAAQPREGTETNRLIANQTTLMVAVYAAQPREGTETSFISFSFL